MSAKSKILIAGGSGLLGINWAASTRNNFDVILGLHTINARLSGVRSQHFNFDSYDILSRQFELFCPNIVINAIGLSNIEKCESDPHLARRLNVDTAVIIAKVCNDYGVPFVHISTDQLFSGNDKLMGEDAQLCPVNIYGKTKAEAENRVLEQNQDALVVRTNFYCWGTGYRQSFSDWIIQSLRSGGVLTLFEDIFYTPILAQDLVVAVHALLDLKATGVYNIVGDSRLSKYEFGINLSREFNLDANLIKRSLISNFSELALRPRDMSLNNQKTVNAIGRSLGSVEQHLADLRNYEKNGLAAELRNI